MTRKVFAVILMIVLVSSVVVTALFLADKPDIERFEETVIDFQMKVTIRNIGQAAAFDIPLRLAIPSERAPVQSLKRSAFSEKPERTSNDSWGNEFVHYSIYRLDPQLKRDYMFNFSIRLITIDYNIQKGEIGKYDDNMDRYLSESSFINYNEPEIIELARQIAEESKNVVDISWNTYEWIVDNIFYQQIPGEWDAATTLKNGEGGSAELGNLFVALMRANGIPARRVSGWGNHFERGENLALTRFSHGWAEFYLPSYGWIQVDPTWGKSHKFDNFAKTDNEHVIMTLGAGIHFLLRGSFTEPFGSTEIDTEYTLKVMDITSKNLSVKRDIITSLVFAVPIIFAAVIIGNKMKQRRM